MKLLIVIVSDEDAVNLLDSLIKEDFRVTKISSTGGFLKLGSTTLLLGVEENRINEAIQLIKRYHEKTKYMDISGQVWINSGLGIMTPMEYQTGGATVFILNVERFERY